MLFFIIYSVVIMAVPAKKKSITKKHVRHSARQRINMVRLHNTYRFGSCSNCGAAVLAHRVCTKCGFYNGKQILTIKTSSKEKVIDA